MSRRNSLYLFCAKWTEAQIAVEFAVSVCGARAFIVWNANGKVEASSAILFGPH
jgi:hypothetical protein